MSYNLIGDYMDYVNLFMIIDDLKDDIEYTKLNVLVSKY